MKIVYIDIDTMSPAHMSCYGYPRKTTPNIDEIVSQKETALFENMYTSDAPCLPSRTSLITGQFGIRHGAVDHGGKYADIRSEMSNRDFEHSLEYDSLFGILKRSGIRTASVSSFSSRHSSWHFNAGLNEVYCYGNSAIQQAEEIYDIAHDWLDRNNQKDDWFLHVHMWDPHTPYRAPKDYSPDFLKDSFEYFVDENMLEEHRMLIGPHTATTLNMYEGESDGTYKRSIGSIENMDDLKTVIDGYDVGISYADYHIGKIINKLKEDGIYDDTIIIISADHGENMGDLGKYSEHATADVATCHIPFIIKIPGKDYTDCKFDAFHYNIDLVPTIAEYFNKKPLMPTTIWDGKSMLTSLKTGKDVGHNHLILSQMSHVLQRGVRFDKYMYIQTYHDGYHPYFEKEMLFNIEKDPHEQKNIALENEEVVKEAKVKLFDWVNEQMANLQHGHSEDPLWYIYHHDGPHHAHKYAEQFANNLEKIGEVKKANIVRDKYSKEFR